MANSEGTEDLKQVPVRDLRSLFERKFSSDPPTRKAQASGSVGTFSCTDNVVGGDSEQGTKYARKTSSENDPTSVSNEVRDKESKDGAPSNSRESLKPVIGPKPTRILGAEQPNRLASNLATNLSETETQSRLSNDDGIQTPKSHINDPSLSTPVAQIETNVEDVRDNSVTRHRKQDIKQTKSPDLSSLEALEITSDKTDDPTSSVSRDRQTTGIDSLRRLFDTEDKGVAAQIPANSLTRKNTSISEHAKSLKPTHDSQSAKRPAPAIPQRKPSVPARRSATIIPSGDRVVDHSISPPDSSEDEVVEFNGHQKDSRMIIPPHQPALDRDASVKKVARRAAPNVPTRKRTQTGPNFDTDTDTKARYLECFDSVADQHSYPKIARPASVRSVWIRSGLPSNYLADVWNTVTDHEDLCKGLTQDQFAAAMKIIDAKLRVHAQFALSTDRIPPQLPQRPIES